LPDIIKLNRSVLETDCEKVRMLADEYLHDERIVLGESGISKEFELSEEERSFIKNHINGCEDCFDLIEAESKYLSEVKIAEYVPEISVAEFVVNKIIENQIIVDKPPKRRIFPVGLVSAAAVVIIMFALARSGPLSVFLKSDQNIGNINNSSSNSAISMDADHSAAEIAMFEDSIPPEPDYGNNGKAADSMADGGWGAAENNDIAVPENFTGEVPMGAYDSPEGEPEGAIAEKVAGETPVAPAPEIENGDMAMAPVPAAAPAPAMAPRLMPEESAIEESAMEEAAPMLAEIPGPVDESKFESMEDYISKYADFDIKKIYEIYFIGACGEDRDELRNNILKDIEVYKSDINANMFDIIEKRYKNICNNNLVDNNIVIGEILSKYQDGEYIAIIYWCN